MQNALIILTFFAKMQYNLMRIQIGVAIIEGYITVKEAAEKWNLHVRSVQLMCSEGRIPSIVKFGHVWAISSQAEPPKDGRITTGQYQNWRKKLK